MIYDWHQETAQVKHYFRKTDGKILGTVWQYVNNNGVWSSKILNDEFPFTDASEKYMGHYIDQDSAKKSVEKFWQIQDNTIPDDIKKLLR